MAIAPQQSKAPAFDRDEERKVTTEIGRDISRARALLERGLTVAIPTETVYGLAANALRPDAVLQIFEIKDRPRFDPLIVHTDTIEKARELVDVWPRWAQSLAEQFWPGPLTLVLAKRKQADGTPVVPDLVTSGHDTVAIRIPSHPITLDLLSQLDFPLAAPSANPFGYVSPTSARHVEQQLGGKIPYILDGGDSRVGVESTIVTERDGEVTVLRLGGLSVEEIEPKIGSVTVDVQSSSNPDSPGKLDHHYAPRKRLFFGAIDLRGVDPARIGIISFQSRYAAVPAEHQIQLSPEGDLRVAARSLFAAMRSFDAMDVDLIFAEEFPEVGLGRAINDRLRRASAVRDVS